LSLDTAPPPLTRAQAHQRENPVKTILLSFALLSIAVTCSAESERAKDIQRLDRAARVLEETVHAPDQRIPDRILRRARCIAVVPHLVKGGFVFGAEEGKGVATCRTARGWSAPAFIQMGGGSWGTQFGVEAVDLVMVIRGREGMEKLLASKFEIGRDASAAVGPVGRHSSENADLALNALILTYSRAKGAFVGMTFDGAVVKTDNDARRAMYGRRVTSSEALLGRVRPPAGARPFLRAARSAEGQATPHRRTRRVHYHRRVVRRTHSSLR
jgi:lipid-binding SYLF domain-containing protein